MGRYGERVLRRWNRGEGDCGCARGMLLKKVLSEVVVQDLTKFSVSTSEGLTVVPWRSALAC